MMQAINLKKFPKLRFITSKTEIHKLSVLSKALGVNLYFKREDHNIFGFGGNKVRKLEYLLGDAQKHKATHILTMGALQSNHAHMTALLANMHGFETELFLKKTVAISSTVYAQNGNSLLNKIIQAKTHFFSQGENATEALKQRVEAIKRAGGRPYVIPIGGSSALSTLGYLDAYIEIMEQQKEGRTYFDHMALATASGGTQAGLELGKLITGSAVKITGYQANPTQENLEHQTLSFVEEALTLIKYKSQVPEKINLHKAFTGNRYGILEPYHIDCLRLLAKTEGIFLDPIYSSKAFSGLLMDIENGYYRKGENILFLHTGGAPSLFAYADSF
ncbi:D-cysteine desulfhydrase family protein [Sphingobacterium sp. Mn56C]|uniref:D-cysteine desulfhydrase family protein n=1 Tax=Sphingobacterium sp. Mn56C TaxID=3395261 RepID=UPI003BDA815D